MVLLDKLLSWSLGEARSAFRVREGAPFVEADVLEVPCTMEHMAQTVAACLGYEAFQSGEGVRVGMIIGCRSFTAETGSLSVGDDIEIFVQRTRGNDMLSHFKCELSRSGDVLATAVMTLIHTERPPGP